MSAKRVAVVGGGAVGTSVAFHLGRREADVEIDLFERDQIASGSTGRALGGVRYLFDHPLNIDMMVENIRFFEDFEDEVGVGIDFDRDGYLFLFRDADVEETWRARIPRYRERGLAAEALTPEETAEVFELIDTSGIRGALYGSGCGFVDPHTVTHAFATRAEELGAAIHTNTAVTDIRVRDGGVAGVDTSEGFHEADYVVNAAGPWAPEVATLAGVGMPLQYIESGYLVADLGERLRSPLVIDESLESRVRAEGNGELLVGLAKRSLDGPDDRHRVTSEDRVDALERATPYVPRVEDLEITDHWTGVLSYTEDGHPILGRTGVEGFLLASGFSGHGLMMAPLVGRALTDVVLEGETDAFDLDALGLDRFGSDDRIEPEAKSTSTRYQGGYSKVE